MLPFIITAKECAEHKHRHLHASVNGIQENGFFKAPLGCEFSLVETGFLIKTKSPSWGFGKFPELVKDYEYCLKYARNMLHRPKDLHKL